MPPILRHFYYLKYYGLQAEPTCYHFFSIFHFDTAWNRLMRRAWLAWFQIFALVPYGSATGMTFEGFEHWRLRAPLLSTLRWISYFASAAFRIKMIISWDRDSCRALVINFISPNIFARYRQLLFIYNDERRYFDLILTHKNTIIYTLYVSFRYLLLTA